MSGKSILIIEDDFETQFLFTELLTSEGFAVKACVSGLEALEALNEGLEPALIFMDLNFPGGTPEEFINKLRAKDTLANTPVILISGKSDIEDYAKKLGAAYYLKKPFDLDVLLSCLEELV